MSTERSPLLSSPQRDRDSIYGASSIRHGRRPLLGEDSDDEAPPADDEDLESRAGETVSSKRSAGKSTHAARRQALRALLYYALLSLAILVLLGLAGTHLIAGRLLARILEDPQSLQKMGEQSFVLSGPFGMSVEEVTDDAVQLRMSARAGVDVRAGLWAQEKVSYVEEEDKWSRQAWVRRVQEGMLRWGTRRAGRVHIQAQDQLQVMAAHRHPKFPFASIELLEPLSLPLHYGSSSGNASADIEWLNDIDLPLRVHLRAPSDMVKLALESWTIKELNIIAQAPKTKISFDGTLPRLLGSLARVSLKNIAQTLRFEVPNLSFLQDPSELVTLTDYAVQPKKRKNDRAELNYAASASIENPLVTRIHEFPEVYRNIIKSLGNPALSVPWSMSADAFLLGQEMRTVNFSRATLRPFDFHLKQPSVQLQVIGQVNPEPSPDLDPALSTLLSNYLGGQETPFKVHPAPIDPKLPKFLADILRDVPLVSLKLPGSPDPDAQLLQNVAIQHMHLDGTGPNSELLVSGSVVGDLVLPEGLEGLASAVQLKSLWPDVLVFDGSPSWTLDHDNFPPDPLPRGAFARLSPQDWTEAKTTSTKDGLHVEMKLEGVPMKVLPGRADLFRGYTAKVIFGTGDGPEGQVRTGIWGFADAKATIKPLPPLTLRDVLVQGEFFVSKGGILGGGSNRWPWPIKH